MQSRGSLAIEIIITADGQFKGRDIPSLQMVSLASQLWPYPIILIGWDIG